MERGNTGRVLPLCTYLSALQAPTQSAPRLFKSIPRPQATGRSVFTLLCLVVNLPPPSSLSVCHKLMTSDSFYPPGHPNEDFWQVLLRSAYITLKGVFDPGASPGPPDGNGISPLTNGPPSRVGHPPVQVGLSGRIEVKD